MSEKMVVKKPASSKIRSEFFKRVGHSYEIVPTEDVSAKDVFATWAKFTAIKSVKIWLKFRKKRRHKGKCDKCQKDKTG